MLSLVDAHTDSKGKGASEPVETLESSFDLPVKEGVEKLCSNIKSVISVDTKKLQYIIAALIAGGHVMLADSHGVGKTSLARALAGSFQWQLVDPDLHGLKAEAFSRIQCTVDLLPQDILGFSRFIGNSKELAFIRGPIFANFVLCDEINLLTPKTQGSFFQAMEEQTVTTEGKTYDLPDPFFLIATMNLKGVHLFPLPAPQLDRFMVQLSMGYPLAHDEAEIIKQHSRNDGWKDFKPVVDSRQLLEWQQKVDQVTIHQDVVDYIVYCVRQTRSHAEVLMGASPRTGVKVSRLCRALALLRSADYVSIDLVKEIFLPAVCHRVIMKDSSLTAESILKEILLTTPVNGGQHYTRQ